MALTLIDSTEKAIGPALLDGAGITGRAVLFRTGWAAHWGTDTDGSDGHPHLTEDTVRALVEREPSPVGIDSVNIDDTATGERPAHSLLLAAEIPIIEHLCRLDRIPTTPARAGASRPQRSTML